MTIREIQARATCVDSIPFGSKGVHESMLRAYQILKRVRDWLTRGVPAAVILELIDEMEETDPPEPIA